MFRFAVLVFAAAALAGPLIRLATWPPSRFEELTSSETEGFVHALVLYLWPAQMLAVVEHSAGRLVAVLYSVGGNLLLFIALGVLVGATGGRRNTVLLLYAGFSGALVFFALWFAGFSLAYLDWLPLTVALVLYAIPFWLVARAARPG